MAALITVMSTQLFPFIIDIFADALSTIMGNPLLFLPICVAFAGTLIMLVLRIIRKFGVRGMAGGRRRRR